MAADPTMEFLADLDDPSKWHVVHNVPVVRPHKRDVKGKKAIEMTEADLPNVAKTINAAYSSAGVPIRVTIGHINQDPDADESNQPRLTGFARDAKVGTFGPSKVPGVLVDLYLRKETARQVLAQHPFRSMEYDPIEKRIHGIALLTRDPALDLGVVTYRSRKWMVHYEEENTAPPKKGGEPGDKEAPKMPGEDVGAVTLDTGTEDDNAPLVVEQDGEQPDGDPKQPTADPMGEDAAYKGFCTMMQRYIASGGLSAMGPMGGAMPQAQMVPAAGEAAAQYQKKGKTVASTIDTSVTELKAEVARLRAERNEEAAKRLLDPLTDEIKFNYAKEAAVLVSLPSDKERIEHVAYMRENYAPLLQYQMGGQMIRTRDAQPEMPKRKGEDKTIFDAPDRYPEIIQYMRDKKLYGPDAYLKAEAAVMEKYQKN